MIKNLLCLFLYIFNGFITMCNLQKRLIHAATTPASDVRERRKTNGTAIKIAKETTNNQ